MRIAFLCSSMEVGCNGVGDYTRLLAGELIRCGKECVIIALSDAWIYESRREVQASETAEIPMLRLSSSSSWEDRVKIAKDFLDAFDPDWVSLQFVPYGFHPKGLPFGLGRRLKKILSGRRIHLMVHELWISDHKKPSHYLVSFLQRIIIRRLVSRLSSDVVHTSIPLYVGRLQSLGIRAGQLELFGNIPTAESDAELPEPFAKLQNLADHWILYFGAAPREPCLSQLVSGLREAVNVSKSRLGLVLISRGGDEKDRFLARLSAEEGLLPLTIADCGFVPAKELSAVLSTCSLGVVRATPSLLGKSGTALAMLEHGLPIWMPITDGELSMERLFRNELIHHDLPTALQAMATQQRLPMLFRLEETAQIFLRELEGILKAEG